MAEALTKKEHIFHIRSYFLWKATVLLHKNLSVSISPSKMADHIRIAKIASQKLVQGGMKIITINIEQGNMQLFGQRSMVEALKGKPGLMKQHKSIFDDLHVAKEFSVYPEFPQLFAYPESSD